MGDVNLLRYALARTQKVETSKITIFFWTAQHMICAHFIFATNSFADILIVFHKC